MRRGPLSPPNRAATAKHDVVHAALAPTEFSPKVEDLGHALAISTPWYRLVLDKQQPRIVSLALDSLGKGELGVNSAASKRGVPGIGPAVRGAPMPPATGALTRTGNVFRYAPVEIAPGAYEQVVIRRTQRGSTCRLRPRRSHTVLMRGGLFRFEFAANQTPTTFVVIRRS